jgi:hypothetical protein
MANSKVNMTSSNECMNGNVGYMSQWICVLIPYQGSHIQNLHVQTLFYIYSLLNYEATEYNKIIMSLHNYSYDE